MYQLWNVISIEHNFRMLVQQDVVAVQNGEATRMEMYCWDQHTSQSDALQRSRTV
jgi:hypothetical protein